MTSTDAMTTGAASLAKHDGEYQKEIDSLEGTIFDPKPQRRSDDFESIWAEVERLGLSRYVAEFEARGYTVIPPEKVSSPEFIERLRDTVLDVAERREGVRPDLYNADSQGSGANPQGKTVFYLLFEDPVFQEAVVNPTLVALGQYALGRSAILYNCTSLIKGPGGSELWTHCDNLMIPSPFPPYPQVVNFTWTLTDYNFENGGTCFIPGSHRYGRHPEPGEGYDERIAPDAPAGSLLMWHGNTWHGSFVKQTPGLRMCLVTTMCRSYIRPQETYLENVPKDILEANPEIFAQLVGRNVGYGWKEEGLDYVKAAKWPGKSQWD
jgi:hypothetical protein